MLALVETFLHRTYTRPRLTCTRPCRPNEYQDLQPLGKPRSSRCSLTVFDHLASSAKHAATLQALEAMLLQFLAQCLDVYDVEADAALSEVAKLARSAHLNRMGGAGSSGDR